jgi:hypothetical protein
VTRYGMSDLGPMTFGESHDMIFLGREITEQKNYSEKVAAKIDEEIAGFIDRAYQTALEVIKKYHKQLKAIADKLIEVETIERAEFEELVADIIPKDKMLKPGHDRRNQSNFGQATDFFGQNFPRLRSVLWPSLGAVDSD